MKTLLYFTPRLVAIVLLVLICSSLLANGTTAETVTTPALSTASTITSFSLVLAIILLPLMTKRRSKELEK